MCFAAKWYGEKDIIFDSERKSGRLRMIKKLHKLLDEADIVVHYNGSKFDVPVVNKEFITLGLLPPSTYKQIDLLRTARKQFKFPSNKLDYLAKTLGLGEKVKHAGFDLWVKCLAGDKDAWETMEEYNKQDVLLLEKVYDKLLPWIPNHPNVLLYGDGSSAGCPTCGSTELQKRGFSYTPSGKFQRYRCNSCGSWHRDTKSLLTVKMTKDKNG